MQLISLRTLSLFLIGGILLLSSCAEDSTPPTGSDLLFHEEFIAGQTGAWLMEGDASGRTAIADDRLLIEIDEPELMQYATLSDPLFIDFVMDLDVTQLSGNPESSFGVLFRLQGPDQFYRFDITGNGLYVMERRNIDGTWTRFFEDWIESPAINQGLDATNKLKIVAEGPYLAFFVNDQLLQQVNDASYSNGQIALDAGTFGHPGLQVAFDNIIIREP